MKPLCINQQCNTTSTKLLLTRRLNLNPLLLLTLVIRNQSHTSLILKESCLVNIANTPPDKL